MGIMEYKIALCGMGPHTYKCHYAILCDLAEKYDISIELLIDLKSRQKVIEKWLSGLKIQPRKCLFLDDTCSNVLGAKIDPLADAELTSLLESGNLNKLMVSTEPKAHKMYVLWGLAHNVDVLVDKPLSANEMKSQEDKTSSLINDYSEIKDALDKATSKLYVMVPKRKRDSYSIIKERAKKIIKEDGIPITYIGLNINEGMWNMPDEFFTRENHPYKYGYGAMLHSGYHYTDFILWLMESNSLIEEYDIDKLKVNFMTTSPNDFVHQIDNDFYKKKLGKDYSSYINDDKYDEYKKMGELDVFLTLQGMHKDICVTSASLNILHTSFSARAWTELPENPYTDNGRVHHHSFCVQFGTLCAIYSTQREMPAGIECETEDEKAGDCIIEIYRNSKVIGGKPYEKIVYSKESSKKEKSYHGKKAEIIDWLEGKDSVCEFNQHYKNVLLLQKLYECRSKADAPYIEVKIK